MNTIFPGNLAPTFSHKDLNEVHVSLRDFTGSKVLLSFFRDASCPFCNMRLRELILNYHQFKHENIHVLAVFHSSKEEILVYAGKQEAPFSILPDPTLNLYKIYGIETSTLGKFKTLISFPKIWKMMRSGFFNLESMASPNTLPADFLIGESGKIEMAYYGKDFGDHIPLELLFKS